MVTLLIGSFIWVFCWLGLSIFLLIMDTPITHINLFNAMLALYVIGYQLSICIDWSWIPMNKEDYQLPYQDKWSRIS
ncbi:hypothetical protein [Prochlorococcus marinus]|uniref:hypothetical protein n=1 Tax=Prochlorococcus marinus TaxID=1219 RepID=UPI0022B474F7|nr:hypothetical protein [Prochlorococcus marinus]